jgi:uncharacterized damage-inducible protein DinB
MNRKRAALIDCLEASGKDLLAYLALLSDDEIHTPPAPNEWTIHQVAAHLRDTEQQVFLLRTQRMVKEAHPAVQGFDQEVWNREHYSPGEPLKKITAEFRAARRRLIRLLRQTSDKDWANWATHPEFGKISLDWLTMRNYSHTLDHLVQIVRVRERAMLRELNS